MNNKKNLLIIVGLFIVIALLIPVSDVEASLARSIASAIIGSILLAVFSVMLMLSMLFFQIGDGILRVVTSTSFIGASYTTNPVVVYGWGIVRDLVNMFFVIILTLIGLGTALRIKNYAWQKTLPRLVAVILLINFSPVILGLFIDFSNIFMNFFLSSIAGESWLIGKFSQDIQALSKSMSGVFGNWDSFSSAMAMPIGLTMVNIGYGLFSILYAILFLMRYIVLWILIILSPLAFAAYILPSTESIANKWRNQFMQWCIIGIPAAFFLYMSDQIVLYTLSDDNKLQIAQDGVLAHLIPSIIGCGFLAVGFFVGLSTSAEGSSAIIGGFKKTVKKYGGGMLKSGAQRAKRDATKALEKPLTGASRGALRLGRAWQVQDYSQEKGAKKIFGGALNAVKRVTGADAIGRVATNLGGNVSESIQKDKADDFKQGQEAIKDRKTDLGAKSAYQQSANKIQKAGVLSEFNSMNKTQQTELLKNVSGENLVDIMTVLEAQSPDKTVPVITAIMNRLAGEDKNKLESFTDTLNNLETNKFGVIGGKIKKSKLAADQYMVSKMKPDEIKKSMDLINLTNKDDEGYYDPVIGKKWDSSNLAAASKNSAFVDRFVKHTKNNQDTMDVDLLAYMINSPLWYKKMDGGFKEKHINMFSDKIRKQKETKEEKQESKTIDHKDKDNIINIYLNERKLKVATSQGGPQSWKEAEEESKKPKLSHEEAIRKASIETGYSEKEVEKIIDEHNNPFQEQSEPIEENEFKNVDKTKFNEGKEEIENIEKQKQDSNEIIKNITKAIENNGAKDNSLMLGMLSKLGNMPMDIRKGVMDATLTSSKKTIDAINYLSNSMDLESSLKLAFSHIGSLVSNGKKDQAKDSANQIEIIQTIQQDWNNASLAGETTDQIVNDIANSYKVDKKEVEQIKSIFEKTNE